MNKMSLTDEARMADTLMAVMERINQGTDPTEAVADIADQQGLSGERVARVCEAANKLVSINRLASADRHVRTSPFPLADARAVMERLGRPRTVKTASAPLRRTAEDGVFRHSAEGLSDWLTEEDRRQSRLNENMSKVAAERTAMSSVIADYDRAGERARIERAGAEETARSLADEASTLGSEEAVELARYIEATYGEQGTELIKMLNDIAEKRLPEVTPKEAAAYVATKDTPCLKLVDAFMSHAYAITEAEADRQYAIKKAFDLTSALMSATKDIVGLDRVSEPLPDRSVNPGKIPFKPEIINKMRTLALKDGFANMYLDDRFLTRYPPETVLDAYNKVMQLVPELATRQNSDALVTAMVKRVLTSSNEIDPVEIPSMLQASSSINRSRNDKEKAMWE